ncbi:uncharacterized protein LOC122619191 [Drosophila teissieri]|uniref:uncharacterized protein LOC122619191 n=1 Tax=Drosophila teissieri TaxID=7243 RepID=UPI001CBA07B0|nr:uncharacterized protein LOC122619191 [Drosophila teissieri]XP_043651896.1 uncharacterized protein LOC122619191 [Drosophila teissieri]XP_043651905.1 uncharacterized protein LOC122619191 [Drosophila teissieri]
MIPNPIEIVCVHVVQPIIDFLGYLLLDVHFIGFLAGVAVLGIILGLILGILSVIWYKSTRVEKTEQSYPEEGDSGDGKKND